MDLSSERKTVLITGAGQGLGFAMAALFRSKGHFVIATDRDPSSLFSLCGENMISFKMDVTDPAMVRSVAAKLAENGISLDILINNAGIFDLFPLVEDDTSRLRRVMDVNAFGPAVVVNAFLGDILANRGRVVMISSESVKFPSLFQPYQVAKIALEAYSRTIRQELALKGASIIVVRPGAIKTRMHTDLGGHTNPFSDSKYDAEFHKFVPETTRHTGQVTEPEIVAERIYRAAISSRPRFIYRINNNPWLTLMSWIPHSLIQKFIESRLK